MILVDSGFWIALACKKDNHHLSAKKVLEKINRPLITTWPVLTESCYFLQKSMGNDTNIRLINHFEKGHFRVFDIKPIHASRIQHLLHEYRDLPMDLADASLVILAEELGRGDILSTDYRDFNVYRWNNRQPFNNLLNLG